MWQTRRREGTLSDGTPPLAPVDTDVGGRRFDWVRLLGRGGSGDVYLAWMATPGGLARYVAVKLLHAAFDPSGRAAERLRAEADLLALLRHPVVVVPIDVFADLGGRAALVTEFIEGQDLSECIDPEDPGRLPTTTLLEVLEHVASALEMAWHQLHVVHRDVKPHNIRIGVHGNVKLLDFGLARAVGDEAASEASTSLAGTLRYLAPERFVRGREPSPSSDVYALGCVLYEGVTGEPFALSEAVPDERATAASWAERLAARLARVADPDVRGLLADMLAFASEARPTAREVGERCGALVAARADHLRLARWCRDRSWPARAMTPAPPPATRPVDHLAAGRLSAGDLSESEEAHVAACFQCRAHRRALLHPSTIGPYQLLGRLGQGAMGDVYAARHADRGESVALKVLHDSRPGMHGRIAREARLQALVDHPHVLPILDVLEHQGSLVLVLPFVPGPNLAAVLAVARPDPATAAAWFAALVDGVASMHAHGLVHRDLKPSNVLLDPSSGTVVPLIADFGLAKALLDDSASGLTRTGMHLGTLLYAAPEQWTSARDVDARADVYALGRIAAELLGPPGVVLPEPWSSIVIRCTATDPSRRPADAAALRALLPSTPRAAPGWAERVAALAPSPEPVGAPVRHESRLDSESSAPAEAPPARRGPRAILALGGIAVAGALVVASLLAPRPVAKADAPPATMVTVAPQPDPPLPPDPAPAPVAAAQADPEPAPRARPRQPVPIQPVPTAVLWVKTKPWGFVELDGRREESESILLVAPGLRTLHLSSHDGAYSADVPIEVREGGENTICWDFKTGAPCSP